MLKKVLILAFALFAYVLAVLAILYLAGFIAGAGVPKTLNDGPAGPVWLAVLVDVVLIAAFGLHHSVAARRRFKAVLLRSISPAIERASYLMMSALMTAALVGFWRPIAITLWHIEAQWGVVGLRSAFLLVVAGMVLATIQLGHLRFFGVAQAWDRFCGRDSRAQALRTTWLYALVRHPISLGWMLLPWLVPHMTAGQALFGFGVAAYVLAATPFEDADLEAELGALYRGYRTHVPALLPCLLWLVPNVLPANDDML